MSDIIKKYRILIVEDERLAAEDLSIRLEQHNCEVVGITGTGKDAIALSLEKNPDIIIMDIQLRGNIDGIETARLIHENQAIPVIFATAYGDDAHITLALENADPYGFLHKPVDDQAAHTMIRIALSRFAEDQSVLRVNDLLRTKDHILSGIKPSDTLSQNLVQFDEILQQSALFGKYWVMFWFLDGQVSKSNSESLSDMSFTKYCEQVEAFKFGPQKPIMRDRIMTAILEEESFYTPMIVENEVIGIFGYTWGFEAPDYSREELVIADISQFFSQRISNLMLKQERLRSQELIAESEAHIKAIVEQSTTGIYLIDNEYKFVYVNDRFCEIFGRSREEIIDHEFPEFLGSSRDYVVANYEDRQAGEQPPSDYEFDILLPDGSVRDLIISANSYTDSSGVVKSTGHILDITDQNLATLELRKLSQAVDQSPVMTVITDFEGKIEYVNSHFTETMGYDTNEVLGQNPRVYKSELHGRDFYANLWETIKSGNVWTGEVINKKKNGELCWSKASISPIRNAHNEITHFVALKEDISNQKAEEDLAIKNQKLKDVLYEITSAAIQAQDVSKLYEKIYLYISEIISTSNFFMALLNKDNNTLYFPFDRDGHNPGMPESIPFDKETSLTARTIVSGKTLHVKQDEIRELIGSGHIMLKGDVPSVWLGIPLKVKDEVIGALVLQEYDGITHYDTEDVRLLDMAAGQVALTIDRARKDNALRELAEELTNANGMKELLLDVITHDLRNPAGVISSIVEMLIAEDDGNELFELLQGSSESLMEVIENATVLSKLSIGEKISQENIDLVPILENIVLEFNSMLATAGMTINLHLPETQMVTANHIISEIPKNYISNAIKYASAGGIIDVILEVIDGRVVFKVEDHGVAIPEDKRQAIFERSIQLAKGKKQGRGLGLAIVKRIAVAHDAEVGIAESPAGGNSFFLKF